MKKTRKTHAGSISQNHNYTLKDDSHPVGKTYTKHGNKSKSRELCTFSHHTIFSNYNPQDVLETNIEFSISSKFLIGPKWIHWDSHNSLTLMIQVTFAVE